MSVIHSLPSSSALRAVGRNIFMYLQSTSRKWWLFRLTFIVGQVENLNHLGARSQVHWMVMVMLAMWRLQFYNNSEGGGNIASTGVLPDLTMDSANPLHPGWWGVDVWRAISHSAFNSANNVLANCGQFPVQSSSKMPYSVKISLRRKTILVELHWPYVMLCISGIVL